AVGLEHDPHEGSALLGELGEGLVQAGPDEAPILGRSFRPESPVGVADPREETGESLVVYVADEEGVDEGYPRGARAGVEEPQVEVGVGAGKVIIDRCRVDAGAGFGASLAAPRE